MHAVSCNFEEKQHKKKKKQQLHCRWNYSGKSKVEEAYSNFCMTVFVGRIINT